MQTFDPILTNEAAVILKVSAETVRQLERTGCLRAVKTSGGVRLFDRAEVVRLAETRNAHRSNNSRSER